VHPVPCRRPPRGCSFCLLEAQPSVVDALLDKGVRQVVYLAHSRLEACQAVAQHVKMCQGWVGGWVRRVVCGVESSRCVCVVVCCACGRRPAPGRAAPAGACAAACFALAAALTSLSVPLPCPAVPPCSLPACSGARRGSSSSGGGASSSYQFEFSLLLMPRRSQVAERILEERGILGDVAIR
jgi:hypothetical protein